MADKKRASASKAKGLGRSQKAKGPVPKKAVKAKTGRNVNYGRTVNTGQAAKTAGRKRCRPNKKRRKYIGITLGILAALLVVLIVTPLGKKLVVRIVSILTYNKFERFDTFGDTSEDTTEPDPFTGEETAQSGNMGGQSAVDSAMSKDIFNILLLGEESIYSSKGHGNTDAILLASMNVKNGTLKLTSILRDSWVKIPGYSPNRINAVFAKGGPDLMYDMLEQNFGVRPDGCIFVDFDAFETIVDSIGGVEITLTKAEAAYLNKENYISNPVYRTVVEGKQILNGNQVVGYCRVRKVATADKEHYDFGRTSRHKMVVEAIYNRCKEKSIFELMSLVYQNLQFVTTDITQKEYEYYLECLLDMGMPRIEYMKIPVDNGFTNEIIDKKDVLVLDFEKNKEKLHEFIYGQ